MGDVVFYDQNGNGFQDGGEEVGISGIKVELLRGGTVVETETTDENGLIDLVRRIRERETGRRVEVYVRSMLPL